MIPQSAVPFGTGPCPPTPNEVPEAVDTALESHLTLRVAQQRWSRSDTEGASHRRIVAEYERRVADSLRDRVRLREEMLAFGAYLRRRDVIPEHIELCVHEAMKDVPTADHLFWAGELGQEIVRWAIQGYYGNGDPTHPL